MEGMRVFGQLMALILVFPIIIIGMVLTTVTHNVLILYLQPLGGFGAFFTIFLSLLAFVGTCAVFPYFWVRTEGFHLLSVGSQ